MTVNNRHVSITPTIIGRAASAWRCDLDELRRRHPTQSQFGDLRVDLWAIQTREPFMQEYHWATMALMRMPSDATAEGRSYYKRLNATHDVSSWLLCACDHHDPADLIRGFDIQTTITFMGRQLPLYQGQIVEISDELAAKRVETAIADICSGVLKLSPISSLAGRFGDHCVENIAREFNALQAAREIVNDVFGSMTPQTH